MYDDPVNSKGYTVTQCQAGGRARARSAKRHPAYGIFLPDTMLFDNLYPSTYQHGKAGGQARAIKAARDDKGRYIKANLD